jgi:type III secretory pathway component EscU
MKRKTVKVEDEKFINEEIVAQMQNEIDSLKKPRHVEFGKIILAIYAISCIVWISMDYLRAFLNSTEINSTVTIAMVSSLVVAILGYYGKSFSEKNSRNKYNVDENGNPINGNGTE